jgi:hypothetical protein
LATMVGVLGGIGLVIGLIVEHRGEPRACLT